MNSTSEDKFRIAQALLSGKQRSFVVHGHEIVVLSVSCSGRPLSRKVTYMVKVNPSNLLELGGETYCATVSDFLRLIDGA